MPLTPDDSAPDQASSALQRLGESLAGQKGALAAVEAAQRDAQRLTRSLGVQIDAARALDAALSATRTMRLDIPRLQIASALSTPSLAADLQRALRQLTAATRRPLLDPTIAQRALDQIQDGWRAFLTSWQGLNTTLLTSFQRIASTVDWSVVLRNIVDLEELAERRELTAAFKSATLLPSPSMPVDLTHRVRAIFRDNGGPSAISNVVSGRYSRSNWLLLGEVTRNWSAVPYLDSRLELMEQSGAAMRAKLYRLVAPSLIPQIEGISADFLRSVTGSGSTSHRGLSRDLAGTIPIRTAVQVGTAAVDGFLAFLDEQLFAFVDFERPGLAYGPRLNRHVLLHGRDLKQATRMNAVRAFILLDVLGAVVRHADPVASRSSRHA